MNTRAYTSCTKAISMAEECLQLVNNWIHARGESDNSVKKLLNVVSKHHQRTAIARKKPHHLISYKMVGQRVVTVFVSC